MEDLARAAGVGVRALQLCFREAYQTSPMGYLRARRLAEVRRRLRRAGPEATTVAEVAMDHGFSHLGRFSRYYREQFGELPSQTLGS